MLSSVCEVGFDCPNKATWEGNKLKRGFEVTP